MTGLCHAVLLAVFPVLALAGGGEAHCLDCHADKRGPFLWEHPPAAEDCSLCHRPHDSSREQLLIAQSPALCQRCHATSFHPALPDGGADQDLSGTDCLDCHSQVHGSNHPSGALLAR